MSPCFIQSNLTLVHSQLRTTENEVNFLLILCTLHLFFPGLELRLLSQVESGSEEKSTGWAFKWTHLKGSFNFNTIHCNRFAGTRTTKARNTQTSPVLLTSVWAPLPNSRLGCGFPDKTAIPISIIKTTQVSDVVFFFDGFCVWDDSGFIKKVAHRSLFLECLFWLFLLFLVLFLQFSQPGIHTVRSRAVSKQSQNASLTCW